MQRFISVLFVISAALALGSGCAGETDTTAEPLGEFTTQSHALQAPQYVVGVYFVGTDITPDPQWEDKLKTAIEMMQDYYGDQMDLHEYPGQTFSIRRDAAGRPQVVLVTGEQVQGDYLGSRGRRQILKEVKRELGKRDTYVILSPNDGDDAGGKWAVVAEALSLMGTDREEQEGIFCDDTIVADNTFGHIARGQLASVRLASYAHHLGRAFGLRSNDDTGDLMSDWYERAGYGRHFVDCDTIEFDAPTVRERDASRLSRHRLFQIAGEPELPNLHIQGIAVTTQAVGERRYITATATICNTGTSHSRTARAALFISDEIPDENTAQNTEERLPKIKVGQCKTVPFSVDVLSDAQTLWILADSEGQIEESDESDNLSGTSLSGQE